MVKNTNNKSVKKKVSKSKITKEKFINKNKKITIALIILIGILLIVSTYAWFSTNLNVRIKTFTMSVNKNTGLLISLDGINFDTTIEVSYDTLFNELPRTYPNNISQWAEGGMVPVSSNGITNHNSEFFNIFSSSGVRYKNKNKEHGFLTTNMVYENEANPFNRYLAFDVFFKNDSNSPISDNLYFDYATDAYINEDASEEMEGLFNSLRIGITKIGSVPKNADGYTAQSITCNNNCNSIIYEPNSTSHTELSIERAVKYGVNLVDGQYFDTYAYRKAGGPIYVEHTVSGSPYMDMNYFMKQETITEADFDTPLFTVPDGITKTRMYIWIEGQDIDSLETDSDGADITVSVSFIKDTQGYFTE